MINNKIKTAITALVISVGLLSNIKFASATIYEFELTGRLTVVCPDGSCVVYDPANVGVIDPYGFQAPISSSLVYDTDLGIGSADLIITPFEFLTHSTNIHDISIEHIQGTNLMLGNMLVDWAGSFDIPMSMIWDASGLLGAFDLAPGGLQVGDTISGTQLKRNGDVIIGDIGSALPATDGLIVDNLGLIVEGPGDYTFNQGPAPLAMTTLNTNPICWYENYYGYQTCMGVNPSADASILTDDGIAGSPLVDGPFPGYNINLDIGSGNSMTVTSVSSVPIPGAIWLFSSGLLGLFGFSRHRKNT